jgi:hypothetical protein
LNAMGSFEARASEAASKLLNWGTEYSF